MKEKTKIKVFMGKAIKDARVQAGFTQEELADKLGISRKTVSSWEIDRTQPTASQVQRIGEILGVSIDGLETIQTLLSFDEYKLIMELREHRELDEEQLTKMFNKIIEHKVENKTIVHKNPIDTNEILHYEIRVEQFLKD